jgi:hypothetical protein
VPPYNRIQPTPLCGPKIGGIVKTRSGPSAFPLHQSGAADADPLVSPMSETSDALAVPVDVTMRRPTLFGVPAMPILAAPLLVRRAQVEEAGALAALLGRLREDFRGLMCDGVLCSPPAMGQHREGGVKLTR